MFKRLDRVGCSDGVLKGGGLGERLEEGPNRSVMYAESEYRYSGDGHAWNSMSDMQLGSIGVNISERKSGTERTEKRKKR